MADRHKWKFVKCNITPALKRLILDRPAPMFVELFVTRRCNLRCSYCFTWKTEQKDPSTAEVKERIDKLKEMGCNVVSFMGGEPMLRSDIVDLTEYCCSKGLYVSMDTNGTALTRKKIDELADAGMSSVVVSLDGINKLESSKKTLHDNPDIVKNMTYARNHRGMRVFVNLVLTKENIREVLPLLEMIKSTGIIFAMSLHTKQPECRISEDKNIEYTDKELATFDKLFRRLAVLKKKGYPIFEPLCYYEKLHDFIRGKHDWECRAGRHFFSVDADGKFLLCSDSDPVPQNLMDMDKHYYRKHKHAFRKQLRKCNKTCTENYAFCASHYNDHKFEFLMTTFK